MKTRAVTVVLAAFLAASAQAQAIDFAQLVGIKAPPLVPAEAASSQGRGYAEFFLGGGISQLNSGWYAMSDEDGYDNIVSNSPGISTDSFDGVIGITYFWPFKTRLWWGAGFTFIYPFAQSLNGATTLGGNYAFDVGPSGQDQPSNWFTAPTIFSFNSPFRYALTPDLLITVTPSLLFAVVYDNSLDVTYFGIGASGSAGLTWYFSERFGTSASVGYRYIYSVSDTYGPPFVADTLYNTYANNGFFGMAGVVLRF